ncbi:hypothetical protein ABW20_dc0102743 [Dactylellina cionopaga]|nr:hypothetical protein ABW20_dc0102743 [Dactylellina cionopaga]
MNSALTSSSFPAFTPVAALVGGLMISSAVNALLGLTGNVFGISGFIHKSVNIFVSIASRASNASHTDKNHDTTQRTNKAIAVAATSGLILGGTILGFFREGVESGLGIQLFDPMNNQGPPTSPAIAVDLFAALSIGLGTKLGSGCTSGHFLCGISRLSPRSIVATAVFFTIAAVTHLTTTSVDPAIPAVQPSLPLSRILLWLLILQSPLVVYGLVVPVIAPKTSDGAVRQYYASALASFATGVHFAFGLGLTGMLRPTKVLGFLNLSPARFANGSWDPSLGLVAVTGILPLSFYWFFNVKPKIEATAAAATLDTSWKAAGPDGYSSPSDNATTPLIARAENEEKSSKPLLYKACAWNVPTSRQITAKLIVGAALFGVGWGLTGLCPGPVLVNFGTGRDVQRLSLFLAAIVAGGLFGSGIEGVLAS